MADQIVSQSQTAKQFTRYDLELVKLLGDAEHDLQSLSLQLSGLLATSQDCCIERELVEHLELEAICFHDRFKKALKQVVQGQVLHTASENIS